MKTKKKTAVKSRPEKVVAMTVQQPQEQTLTERTPADLIAMAIQSGNISIDVLERLSALQQQWIARKAKAEFIQALVDFQAEVPTIRKNKNVKYKTKSNDVVTYDHAELDHIVEIIKPFKKKYGLTHEWKYEHFKDNDIPMIRVFCVVSHIGGHSESTSMEGGHDDSGGKNGIQGRGSTVTYLQRYSLIGSLGLTTAGTDKDGKAPEDQAPEGEKTKTGAKPNVTKPAIENERFNKVIFRINKGDDIAQECKNNFTLTEAQLKTLNEVDEVRLKKLATQKTEA